MRMKLSAFLLAASITLLQGCGDSNVFASLVQAKQLSPEAGKALAAMPFDSGAAVTVHGRATILLFGDPGTMGMIAVQAMEGAGKYAFSTAATKDLAKQGFSRFSLKPGAEILVTGVLAKGGQGIEGFTAARADKIATFDGTVMFDRAALP